MHKLFLSTKLFRILEKASRTGADTDISVLENNYYEFVLLLFSEGAASTAKAAFYNTLVYTRVELKNLRGVSGKNVAIYLRKAIELLEGRIEWIEKQIPAELTVTHCPLKQESPSTKRRQWMGSPMEPVELVYALKEAGCFGKSPLKTLFDVIGKMFGCEIPNYSRLFWDVCNRSNGGRTFFLNKLLKSLSNKLIRMDSGKR